MKNFDNEARSFRDQMAETLYQTLEANDVKVLKIIIKPTTFEIHFEDQDDESRITYQLPLRPFK